MKTQVTLANQLFHFYRSLKPPGRLPAGIEVLHPQRQPAVMQCLQAFLLQYFNDHAPRRIMLGINPGRLGAGITGVNFTAPRQLTMNCGIEHHFGNSSELSAEFIYDVIDAFGGATAFYQQWLIGSVCTLGFTKAGKNINYYDEPALQQAVLPFIKQTLRKQLSFHLVADHCICLGGEKNYRFLSTMNETEHWFNSISCLPHPRFIMQYKRKEKQQYIDQYLQALNS